MRILIVEDEYKIANALKKGLEQESYAVDVEYDADGGLGSAMTGDHDLIILDRMLPGSMEGLEICAELRKEGIKTPVLILTAKDQVEDRVAGLNTGADDYLVKPFAFEELLARVRALLRRPTSKTNIILVCDDLKLDTINRTVVRMNKPIELSRKEFGLLEYLLHNQNKVISKEELINHVWNFDADILPNTVEAFISNLRDKIEKPFPKLSKLIYTVRGFGYKIQA